MNQQLKDIQYPYPYTFFDAFAPDNSRDYLNIDMNERNKLLSCCLRSHVSALHAFLSTSEAEYVVILEDDICFQKTDLKKELNTYMDFLEKDQTIHYISFSYRPYYTEEYKPIASQLSKLEHEHTIYWGYDKVLWGSQGYILSRSHVKTVVDCLYKSTLKDVVSSMESYLAKHKSFSMKTPQLLIDSLLPILLNQGIVYPMLAVETDFKESISFSDKDKKAIQEYKDLVKSEYYSLPLAQAQPQPQPQPQQPTVYGCIISTMSKERIAFMTDQFNTIHFPYTYEIFRAYTKEMSLDYLDVPKKEEPDLLLLCMRSHIAAMESCLRSSDAEYFLLMEDDVAFQTCDLHEKIQAILSKLKSHPELDYVSLSYIPTCLDKTQVSTNLHLLNRDDYMYWGFDKSDVDFTIWGSQAYILSRETAQKLVSLLHHSKLSDVRDRYFTYLKSNKTYANKVHNTTIDALMPLLLNQAILHPMLCVERYFSNSISNSAKREKEVAEYCSKVDCMYYL